MNLENKNSTKELRTDIENLSFLVKHRDFGDLLSIYIDKSPRGRIKKAKEAILWFFESFPRELFPEEKISAILKQIDDCADIQNFKDCANKILDIAQPIFNLKNSHPLEYEEAKSHMGNKMEGYIELNRFITYKKVGDTIALHHSMAEEFIKVNGPKPSFYANGMSVLVDIIQNDPEIKKVEATSWIVYKMRKLFERKGFTVEEFPQKKSSMQKIFGNKNDIDNRKVATASISREKFLEVFGKK